MRLPKLDDLIDEQLLVYEHAPDQHLFVAGPPGSGKTSLAVLRAKYLQDLGQETVLVTKNRMLATLANQLSDGRIQTQTMNTFISKAYFGKFGKYAPEPTRYQYDWENIIAAYEVAGAVPTLDHLVIDEGQNLPRGFFNWALRFSARATTVFADEDQTTDALRASLKDICDAGMPNPLRLQENHRNSAEIASVAEYFHRSQVLPPGIVRRRGGETPRLVEVKTWDDVAALIDTRYRNRGEAIGVVVYRQDDVRHLRKLLAEVLPENTRVDAYTSSAPGAAAGIQILQPGITVLSSESVIGLEFNAVYLQDLSRSLPCAMTDDYRRMYMLCARARDALFLLNGPSPLTSAQIASLPGPALLER